MDNNLTYHHFPDAEIVETQSTDIWVKVVGFMEHNWGIVEKIDEDQFKIIFFIDSSEIFDELNFLSLTDAKESLIRNGFDLWDNEDDEFKSFIPKPKLPLYKSKYSPSNENVYSSGQFWK